MKNKITKWLLAVALVVAGCADGALVLPPDGIDKTIQSAAIKSFAADKTLVDPGESVTLSWETELASKIEIESNNPKKAFSFVTEKAEEILKSSTVVENITEETTFTLKAWAQKPSAEGAEVVAETDATKQVATPEEPKKEEEASAIEDPVTKTVTVRVRKKSGELNITSFYADADRSSVDEDGNVVYITDGKTALVLQWAIMGDSENLKVILASDTEEQPILVDCLTGEEMMVTDSYPATGCARVEPMQNTAYTLTATSGEKSVSKALRVEMEQLVIADPVDTTPIEEPVVVNAINCADFVATSDITTPLFAGEKVAISWSAPETSGAKGVRITSGSEAVEELSISGSAQVTVPADGTISVVFMAGENEVCAKSIVAPVARFEKISDTPAIRVASGNGSVKVGGETVTPNDEKKSLTIGLSEYSPAYKDAPIDYTAIYAGYNDLTKKIQYPFLKNVIKTFPVNAIAVAESGETYIGTTGAIFQKTAEGLKTVTSLLRIDYNKDYSGEHETCFGQKQTGKKAAYKGEIVSMSQVCDLAIVGDKLFAATDRGFFSLANVAQYMADNKSVPWVGRSSEVYASVVNAIQVKGSEVYVAGSKGIYVSSDDGAKFTQVETGSSSAALSLYVDEKVLFVGTSSGLSVVEGGVKVRDFGIGAVRHIVKSGNAIYAASEQGIHVSRDGGVSFNAVSSEATRSLAVFVDASGLFNVYAATSGGLLKASAMAIPQVVENVEDEIEDTTTEEETAEQPAETAKTVRTLSQTVIEGPTLNLIY